MVSETRVRCLFKNFSNKQDCKKTCVILTKICPRVEALVNKKYKKRDHRIKEKYQKGWVCCHFTFISINTFSSSQASGAKRLKAASPNVLLCFWKCKTEESAPFRTGFGAKQCRAFHTDGCIIKSIAQEATAVETYALLYFSFPPFVVVALFSQRRFNLTADDSSALQCVK